MRPARDRTRLRRSYGNVDDARDFLPLTTTTTSTTRRRRTAAMNRRSRKIIVAFAVSIFVLISYLYLNREHLPFSEFADSTAELVQTGRGEPKITVIVPWQSRNGAPPPPYIPYFFQSVEANPKVDLLFIHIVDHQDDCSPFWNAPNVKARCSHSLYFSRIPAENFTGNMSQQPRLFVISHIFFHFPHLTPHFISVYELHADYLCERWKCTQEEKTYLLDFIIKQGARDGVWSPPRSVVSLIYHAKHSTEQNFLPSFPQRSFQALARPSDNVMGELNTY